MLESVENAAVVVVDGIDLVHYPIYAGCLAFERQVFLLLYSMTLLNDLLKDFRSGY